MAKKIKPPVPVKMRNFTAVNTSEDAGNTFDMPWEVRRRLSRKDAKTGKRVDTEKVIGSVCFSDPDQYKCSSMSITFEEALTKDEYFELLNGIMSYADTEDRMTFARIEKSKASDNQQLLEALEQMGFEDDPLDEEYLIYEDPITSWGPIYMCFGLAIGMSIGGSQGHQSVGMCLGMAIGGLMLGNAMSSSAKSTRGKLKEARVTGGNPPEEDEE